VIKGKIIVFINILAETLAGFTAVALLVGILGLRDLESALCLQRFGQEKATVTVERQRIALHRGVVPNRILVRCK
jgi:hypothetical protein